MLPVPIDLISPLIKQVENGGDRKDQAERRRAAREHERALDAEKVQHEIEAEQAQQRELADAEGSHDLPPGKE